MGIVARVSPLVAVGFHVAWSDLADSAAPDRPARVLTHVSAVRSDSSRSLIQPEEHGLLLVDWCASVLRPSLRRVHLPFVSTAFEAWYPRAVLAGGVPSPATDLEMALRCMGDLLGGDPLRGSLPALVPAPLRSFLRSALRSSASRPDAGQLYHDFSDLVARLWGRRRYVPFSMPPRA
jgi:hypothetical protein